MRNVYLVTVVLILLSCAVLASAEPTMRGYSGLFLSPTTDALGAREYNVAMSTSEISDWDDRTYIVNVGLQEGLEAGVCWWHPGAGYNETLLNAKYRFQPGAPGRASLALGVSDITDEIDTAVYFVASKEMGRSVRTIAGRPVKELRLHGGIGGGWIDDFFFGAEVRLGSRVTIIAEHMNDDLSLGGRLRLWRTFTVDAGYIGTKDWAATISYNYPLQTTGELRPVIGE